MSSALLLATLLSTASQPQPSSEVIGGYAAGCVQQAQALALHGEGFQVIRTERERYFGHPQLINFVTQLGKSSHAAGLPGLYIGDLSARRGGPFAYGHSSHQNGLDVDIWFRMHDRPIRAAEAREPAEWPLIDEARYVLLPERFGTTQYQLLKLAATPKNVARIFIHPLIKQAVCQRAGAHLAKADWISKLRPWVGHFSHFHVRLACPSGSPECKAQAPILWDASGQQGCGAELASWLKDKPRLPKVSPKRKPPQLPARCQRD
ncbi:MAG: penicillin-insensitive murein endopeptidase [Aeromonas sp.]